MLNALQTSHQFISKLISKFPDGNFIDATLGNGNDSLFILNHDEFQGQLFAFDIQEQAIINSKGKLRNHEKFAKIEIFKESHHKIEEVLENITEFHGAIYNLGYLPGADHEIVTQGPTTIHSIQQILDKLVIHGQIIIVIYWGHQGGQDEKDSLFDYLQNLEQRKFQVASYQFINQQNAPPILIILEKLK